MTVAALGGTTVHSAFSINNNRKLSGLKIEILNEFRAAFADVFIDECSIGRYYRYYTVSIDGCNKFTTNSSIRSWIAT